MKKFQRIDELIAMIDKNENYNHEIKGKRLKKELKSLEQHDFQGINLKRFEVTNVAIFIIIDVEVLGKTDNNLVIRLDRQYPFNPPQLFYRSNPTQNGQYGYCKDLLCNILKDQLWGPSLTLPIFLQKLSEVASGLNKKQKLTWSYHSLFEYGKDELLNSGVKLFQIQQYKWEYKILKMKRVKMLGLTPDCLLKFEISLDSAEILKLDFWSNIKDIVEVKATPGKKNYQLQISYNHEEKLQKMYLGGKASTDLQAILDRLNPIQMVERKVKNFQKSGITDYDDAIQSYSALIEHYSLTNKELSDKYMVSMKKIIQSHYDSSKKQNPQKMVEIQT